MTEASGAYSGFNGEQYIPKICVCKTINEEITTTLLKTQKKWLIVAIPMTDMTKAAPNIDLHNALTVKNLHGLS